MSTLIKFAICFVLSIVSIKIVNNSNVNNKRWFSNVCSIFFAILFIVSVFVPFEDFLFQFDSLAKAYEYRNPDAEIRLVVEGIDSDFVSGDENGKEIIMFVPKSETGWKVGTGLESKIVARSFHNKVAIDIYQYKDSGDFYAMVYDLHGAEIEITDSCKSEYVSLKKVKDSGTVFTKYYAYIAEYDEDYWICINGEKIELKQP